MAQRKIQGCRTILTGASSGIGRALAVELIRRGGRLVVVARRREKLDALADQVRSLPGAIEIVAGDVTLPEVREQAVACARDRFGGLDLLINNAGVGARSRFEGGSPERLRRIMEVNFFATAETIRAALPELKRGNRPMIVNVSSILGHRGVPRLSEYCASKFALQGFSESLRAELAPAGVDLLVVSPGTTDTEFYEHALEQDASPWPKQPGVAPEVVARAAIRAIERGRHEVLVNRRGKLLVWLNRLAPGLVDRFLARYG